MTGQERTVAVYGPPGVEGPVADRVADLQRDREYETADAVLDAVAAGEASYGIIPIHTADGGAEDGIPEELRLIDEYGSEEYVLAGHGNDPDRVEAVYAAREAVPAVADRLGETLDWSRDELVSSVTAIRRRNGEHLAFTSAEAAELVAEYRDAGRSAAVCTPKDAAALELDVLASLASGEGRYGLVRRGWDEDLLGPFLSPGEEAV